MARDEGWLAEHMLILKLYPAAREIATPGTVDRICGEAGLLTRGEVNCRTGENVVGEPQALGAGFAWSSTGRSATTGS
ncbi:hypothetical protein SHIRM173S_09810 [Streptomyces hirsutus]